jgi:hypothetical protein
MRTRDILTNRPKNMGRLEGPATNSSKKKIVLPAKTTIKKMRAASFFKDENILAKVISPLS